MSSGSSREPFEGNDLWNLWYTDLFISYTFTKMTRQEEFDYSAREAEKISAQIYKLYCRETDEEDQKYFLDSREELDKALEVLKEEKKSLARVDEEELSEQELVDHNTKISSLLERIQSLVEENQGFLYNY